MKRKKITVNDKIQENYVYFLTEPIGENFDSKFKPELTPKEMLELGVFEGAYLRDCKSEFPASWFKNAKFSIDKKDPQLNFFKVSASQPLKVWQDKGWILSHDPRGWFQWYCRYYQGRRCEDDEIQIKRWLNFARHKAQVQKNCEPRNFSCRPKQRQALLHWAYDSRKI